MSHIFGGKTRDIQALIQALTEGASAICNESAHNTALYETDVTAMAESITSLMGSHYGDQFPDQLQDLVNEDAQAVGQMFINNMKDAADSATLTESAIIPNVRTLTMSIATTMRTPYEATLHRLFDTRTIDKRTVEIEEVIPTIQAPNYDVEDLVDALAPSATTPFLKKTEINVPAAIAGIVPGSRNVKLLDGMDPLYTINRDMRISKIDVSLDSGATLVAASKIAAKKGTVLYFDAKDCTLNCTYVLTNDDGTTEDLNIDSKIDFNTGVMSYLTTDSAHVVKVYFDATVAHDQHTHPILTSFRNNFMQFTVPTRPHVEVSLTLEQKADITNTISHFGNNDIVSMMTGNITEIVSRLEDQRLKEKLDLGREFVAHFNFEAPANFAYGNLEWFKREFIPFLDQCAAKMKNDWNITDCHFRVGVSPYLLKIMDTDYNMDKSMTEESRGTGVINYSIGVKTSTATFYFVSSQILSDNVMKMLLIPNNFKMSQVKTYNYFKYSSFLTDQLRQHNNPTIPAVVYTERNLPLVFRALCTDVTIDNLPITKTAGDRWIVRSSEVPTPDIQEDM